FQAEDGIRGKLVTGVQTCALPICTDRPDHSSSRFAAQERTYAGVPLRLSTAALVQSAARVAAAQDRRAGAASPPDASSSRQRAEIGRASCRERVEISVEAGSLTRT